jgi:acetylornithine deacetylase
VVVGEPTDMVAVNGHKGIAVFRHGQRPRGPFQPHPPGRLGEHGGDQADGHCSSCPKGWSATPIRHSPFTPKGATLTIGQVNGGTAVNILARECVFIFDLRTRRAGSACGSARLLRPAAKALDAELKARAPEAGVSVERP